MYGLKWKVGAGGWEGGASLCIRVHKSEKVLVRDFTPHESNDSLAHLKFAPVIYFRIGQKCCFTANNKWFVGFQVLFIRL